MADGTPGNLGELPFFGRMVAGTTHELVNVLNIVGELAGLQDDLLRAAAAGQPLDQARLAALAERTRAQAERGHALLRQLNRFAHSVDREAQRYDLGDLLETFVSLSDRFARLARTRLECSPPSRTVVIEGNAFAAHLALFLCLDAALAGSSSQRAVRISASPTESGAGLVVESADPLASASDGPLRERLVAALAACPGELLGTPNHNDPHRFTMQLRSASQGDAASREGAHAP